MRSACLYLWLLCSRHLLSYSHYNQLVYSYLKYRSSSKRYIADKCCSTKILGNYIFSGAIDLISFYVPTNCALKRKGKKVNNNINHKTPKTSKLDQKCLSTVLPTSHCEPCPGVGLICWPGPPLPSSSPTELPGNIK